MLVIQQPTGSEKLIERYRSDGVIVCEPTRTRIAVAHMGFIWVEVETIGKAVHGSVADRGRDAIADMASVINEIEYVESSNRFRHPILGTPKFHTSKITGGRDWSTVLDYCKLSIERRTLPGETSAKILAEIRVAITRAKIKSPGIKAKAHLVLERTPFLTPRTNDIVRTLTKSQETIGLRPKFVGVPYWSDASIFQSAGIPSVIFGSGDYRVAHSAVEFVSIAEVLVATRVVDTAFRFLDNVPHYQEPKKRKSSLSFS